MMYHRLGRDRMGLSRGIITNSDGRCHYHTLLLKVAHHVPRHGGVAVIGRASVGESSLKETGTAELEQRPLIVDLDDLNKILIIFSPGHE